MLQQSTQKLLHSFNLPLSWTKHLTWEKLKTQQLTVSQVNKNSSSNEDKNEMFYLVISTFYILYKPR